MLELHNTLAKKKEEFKPIHKGKVSIYTCGPTVYDFVHIGNLRSYMTADILRRYLEYSGYEVRHIKNITDVGHLTQDAIAQADTGEDKILKKALAEKKTPEQIAEFYTETFHHDEDSINILRAHFFPKATAHIPQMIKIIETLVAKGNAYAKNGNVFFNVTSFLDYGKLSGNTLDNLKIGARLEEHPDKINSWDFALWLKADSKHILQWDSPWSRGYPGWHIECSAMATEYLGDTLDIHTGGEDNIFPHHEAEIAQTECATGKKFVNFWIHTRHLLIEGEKMSKSKGNFYKLQDIIDKDFSPMHLRLFYLSSHYKKQADFSWKTLGQAKKNYERIIEWVGKLKEISKSVAVVPVASNAIKQFESAMDDDLNTPLALTVLYNLITESNKKITENKLSAEKAKDILTSFEKMNKVFGLTIIENTLNISVTDEINISDQVKVSVKKIAKERLEARKNKDFKKADELRKKIEKMGFEIEDLGEKYKIKKK
jgi:cysteinyl-tRNA synthetase